MSMEFTLSAGVWEYWFRDKENLKPLTPRLYVGELIMNETKITIDVPEELKNNPNAVIFIQRSR